MHLRAAGHICSCCACISKHGGVQDTCSHAGGTGSLRCSRGAYHQHERRVCERNSTALHLCASHRGVQARAICWQCARRVVADSHGLGLPRHFCSAMPDRRGGCECSTAHIVGCTVHGATLEACFECKCVDQQQWCGLRGQLRCALLVSRHRALAHQGGAELWPCERRDTHHGRVGRP